MFTQKILMIHPAFLYNHMFVLIANQAEFISKSKLFCILIFNVVYSCDAKLHFQQLLFQPSLYHTLKTGVLAAEIVALLSFRNHSNMLIRFSRNIYYYRLSDSC